MVADRCGEQPSEYDPGFRLPRANAKDTSQQDWCAASVRTPRMIMSATIPMS